MIRQVARVADVCFLVADGVRACLPTALGPFAEKEEREAWVREQESWTTEASRMLALRQVEYTASLCATRSSPSEPLPAILEVPCSLVGALIK